MKINGTSNVKLDTFESLKPGDIFCLQSDIKENGAERICIKCDSKVDTAAVDLKTGAIYMFYNSDPVKKIDAYLEIKN